MPAADELGDLVARAGRRVDVDLAADRRRWCGRRPRASQGSGPRVLSKLPIGRWRATRPRSRRAYQTTLPGIVDRMPHSSDSRRRRPVGRLCQTDAVAGVAGGSPSSRAAVGERRASSAGAWPTVPAARTRLPHLEVLPRREATTAAWPAWAQPDVVGGLRAAGRRPTPWRTRRSPPRPPTPGSTWWSRPARRRASRWPTCCPR